MRSLSRPLALAAVLGSALAATGCAAGGPYLRMPYGLLGLVILIADIWAIIEIVQSGKSTGNKVLWILLILFFPLIGVILYFLLGRGR